MSADPREHVLQQLSSLAEVQPRSMFGGWGLYLGDDFFGMLYRDRLYFRTDVTNREDYVSRGMNAFRPFGSATKKLIDYYEVPADVLADPVILVEWALKAVAARPPPTGKYKKAPPASS